uniref:Phosphoglycolate phosphatase n=1 Tax=Candidatus Kentrum sp. FW TaxID=2126338 RepID=A0A450RTI0_9GAMM|nr:MAG: phosphoglycolate phosphatase [Candidatus Kentron sp. FW]
MSFQEHTVDFYTEDTPCKNTPYTLLVFDWDGTLMDSEAKIIDVCHTTVDDLGLPRPSDASIRDVIGLALPISVRALFPGREDSVYDRIMARYQHYFINSMRSSEVFPDVPETLRTLRENGFLMAVATGKTRDGLERDFLSTGLREMFHVTRCADEALSKPHPRMLHQIMTELMVEPEATLMIGDSVHDLEMARNAGVDAIAVTYGVLHDRTTHLLQYKPRACLDAFGDLVDWLACHSQPSGK